jgi:hypothetical protein
VRTAVAVPEAQVDPVVVEPTGPRPRPRPDVPAVRRPLPPWAIALAGLAVGISLLVTITLSRRLSTDVFWQLAAGQWMLAHHHVIGLDPFSYTESHHRWVADEWGSEVVLASMYKVFGAAAYNLISILTGTLCLVCTMLYARALGARGGRLAGIAILMALGIAAFVTQDRGLSFSLIWLPLELLILARARTNRRWLLGLPVLCLLWVNTHGSILLGLAVLGAELGWSLVPERFVVGGLGRSSHPGALALAALASLLASCVSPYGPKLLTYDLNVARNPQISQYIEEWKSPDFHSLLVLLFVGVPLVVLVLALRRRRFLLLEATLGVALFVGTLHSVRIVIYLMVVSAGLAASLPARRAWGPRARRLIGASVIGLLVALVAVPSVPAGSVSLDTPVQAFTFLAPHPGRIFTEYTWADYAIARHRATFVDGRTDLFVGPVLSDYFAVADLTARPDPVLSRYRVDFVVWAPHTPLAQYLAGDSRWEVVDRTSQSVVFARRTAWAARS